MDNAPTPKDESPDTPDVFQGGEAIQGEREGAEKRTAAFALTAFKERLMHISNSGSLRSMRGRVLLFIENPVLLAMVGIVAVFFSIVDGRYISAVTLMLSYGLHRSLEGWSRKTQIAIHSIVFCLLFWALWQGGVKWNVARDNSPLVRSISDAVTGQVTTAIGKLIPGDLIRPKTDTATKGGASENSKRLRQKDENDPRIQLIQDAQEMADKLTNIHTQMRKDLDDVQKQFAWDTANSPQDEGHKEFLKQIYEQRDRKVRVATRDEYQKCCQTEAIRLREQLMLKVGGVTDREKAACYSSDHGPSVPDAAGTNSADFTCMTDDLNNLTHALEVKLRNAEVNSGLPIPPLPLPFSIEAIQQPSSPPGYSQMITIPPENEIRDGYIVVKFRGTVYQVACDLARSEYILRPEEIQNENLRRVLSKNSSPMENYIIQVGQVAVSKTHPVHVFVGGPDMRVDSVTYFQEQY